MIILDCDTDAHEDPKGGFCNRNSFLKSVIEDLEVTYFLIPNHQDDGNLESLLNNAIGLTGMKFYNCITNYVECVKNIIENVPIGLTEYKDLNKMKLEWYTYGMLGKAGSKVSKERDYSEQELWNLDSDALLPLKKFMLDTFK